MIGGRRVPRGDVMRKAVLVTLFLLSGLTLTAAPPEVPKEPTVVKVGKDRQVEITSSGPFTAAPGFSPDEGLWFPGERSDDGKKQIFLFRPYRKGEFRVTLWTEGDKRNQYSVLVLKTEEAPAPVPPGPTPDPDVEPVDPDEEPDPFLVPGVRGAPDGLRVLIVFQDTELTTLQKTSPGTYDAMYSEDVYKYVASKAVKGPNGAPDFRIWDADVVLHESVADHWRKAWSKPRKSLPWVYIGNGRKGYSGPMPDSKEKFLTLLRKYGGN